jgi:hypothetical protein
MANTYRLYRSPLIGTGVRGDPFRSKLTQYIVGNATGQTFWDWIHDARPVRYALTFCDTTIHPTIAADAQMTVLSAQLADLPALEAWLNEPAGSVPQAIIDVFESDGFHMGWASGATTKREVLRYIAKVHVMIQDLKRLRDNVSIGLFTRALTVPVSDIPVNVRQQMATWMQSMGLDTSWIVGSTLVREVIHYIMQNRVWPDLQLGPVDLG